MVDIERPILKVDILYRQSAKLRNTHPGMKKDINHFVVFTVDHIVMDELDEFPHLISCDRLSPYHIVYHNSGKFESERVVNEDVIINRHLKCGAQNSSYRMDGTEAPSILLLKCL